MKSKKTPLADQISDKYAKMQTDMIQISRTRRYAVTFCALFLSAFLILFGSLFFVLPQKTFSENENRILTSSDSLSARAIFDGGFPERISTLISDQFPMRDAFVGIESYLSLAFTGKANNVKFNNYSLSKEILPDSRALENLDASLDAVSTIGSELKSRLGIESTFVSVPLPCRAYQNRVRDEESLYSTLDKKLDKASFSDFASFVKDTDGIFYKTDHHLNSDGTYLMYLFLCKKLSLEAKTDLKQICVSNNFYGTAWSQSGLWGVSPDSIYVHSYEDDDSYVISGDIESNSLYFPEKLESKDKYAYFLGGNYGHIEIKSKSEENRPRLLIIKDSYANSLIPLLLRHFDLCVIDPRYYSGDLIADAQKCDKALFLFGVSSLITDVGLAKLSFDTE